jgi:alkylhydroperoxidase/carboxymuconolactone decarboxylase family protein YurZ
MNGWMFSENATMIKKVNETITEKDCPTKGSQHSGVTRRQFATNAGALLGILVVGKPALGQTPVAESGKPQSAPDSTGTQVPVTHGPWDPALEQLREWDPKWAEACEKMSMNPWVKGVLPRKTIELISVGLNAACTNLNPDGTRRHIRAALEAGATREEILLILKGASLMSIHSCSLGAPILLEEANAAGVQLQKKTKEPTPASDKMKKIGQWNTAWDPFFEVDAGWTDEYFAAAGGIYTDAVLSPKDVELLSIALDASFTHMYAPGTRRHIAAALKLGATMEEIMEVLKLCVSQGMQACNLGVPILAEELARRAK